MKKTVFRNQNGNYYVTNTVELGFETKTEFIACSKKQKKHFDYLFETIYVQKSKNGNPYIVVEGYMYKPTNDFQIFCLSPEVKKACEEGKLPLNHHYVEY